jgi:hypothetical protein
MKKISIFLTASSVVLFLASASLSQQQGMEKPPAREGQAMAGGMGMMCPCMTMDMPTMHGMMGGMSGDPKMMGRMMEMHGEMMMRMDEVMMKHGKMMQKGTTK